MFPQWMFQGTYLDKLQKQAQLFEDNGIQVLNEPLVEYRKDLPF